MTGHPAPGLYEGVTLEEYLAWDAVSASRLSDLRRSAAYCKHRIDRPRRSTAAQEVGAAVHCAVLEPDRFEKTYQREPQLEPGETRRAKRYKREREALEMAGRTVLQAPDWYLCEAIRESVWSNPFAREVLGDASTRVELSVLAELPVLRTRTAPTKTRPDIFAPDCGLVVDLKTARDASRRGFERAALNHGYSLSAVLCLLALEALGHRRLRYVFLAVEKSAPHEVGLYELDWNAREAVLQEVRSLLIQYEAARESGVWPGYSEKVQKMGLPPWAGKGGPRREEDDEEEGEE